MRFILSLLILLAFIIGCKKQESVKPTQGHGTNTINRTKSNPTNVVIITSGRQGEIQYRFATHKNKIDQLPDWDILKDPVPLQFQQAIQLAINRYKILYPSITNIRVLGISLRGVSWGSPKWTYNIDLEIDGDKTKNSGLDWPFTAIVLLDGTVIDPTPISRDDPEFSHLIQ